MPIVQRALGFGTGCTILERHGRSRTIREIAEYVKLGIMVDRVGSKLTISWGREFRRTTFFFRVTRWEEIVGLIVERVREDTLSRGRSSLVISIEDVWSLENAESKSV